MDQRDILAMDVSTSKYKKRQNILLNYFRVEQSVFAGEYPFAVDTELALKKIEILKQLKISYIIDLTEEGELLTYSNNIVNIIHKRFPISDRSVPKTTENMHTILECIHEAKKNGERIYIHCWGGVGRTGTVIGCWFLFNGLNFEESMRRLRVLWKTCPKSKLRTNIPEYDYQIDFIKRYELYLQSTQYKPNKLIVGAIIGDIIGSVYEHKPQKTTDFPLFCSESTYTDDTVLTIASMDAILNDNDFKSSYRKWGNRYRGCGFGINFLTWLIYNQNSPNRSKGNGVAMRISPIAYRYEDFDKTIQLANESAMATHSHPEALIGAQAVACCIYMALHGATKSEIKKCIEEKFGYNLNRTVNEIRENYKFDATCAGSIPEAIIAFLESTDFVSSIRLAISLGGDSDTQAAISASIAEAYYKTIPSYLYYEAMCRIDSYMYSILCKYQLFIKDKND